MGPCDLIGDEAMPFRASSPKKHGGPRIVVYKTLPCVRQCAVSFEGLETGMLDRYSSTIVIPGICLNRYCLAI